MNGSAPGVTPPVEPAPDPEALKNQRKMTWGIIGGVVVVLIMLGGMVFGLTRDATVTANLRDIVIIFMALESLLIGFVLVILIVQLARLINLLQNEIKPILDSTNETMSTMRGTINFLSDNLTEPVVKLNESMAAVSAFGKFFKSLRGK